MANSSSTAKAKKAKTPSPVITQPVAPTPTPVSQWKGKKTTSTVDLELPSGNVCQVKLISIPEMIASGLMADSLLPIVDDHVNVGQGKRPSDRKQKKGSKKSDDEAAMETLRDPRKMAEMFDGIDKAVAQLVVQPPLLYHRQEVVVNDVPTGKFENIPDSERDDEVLYTDQIDFQDKMYIFNFMLGGSSDLEQFRRESGPSLDGLRSLADDAVPAE